MHSYALYVALLPCEKSAIRLSSRFLVHRKLSSRCKLSQVTQELSTWMIETNDNWNDKKIKRSPFENS